MDVNVSPHLLIVDDDRDLRELLSKFLKREGYRVDVARDGREMWRSLDDWRIDLIVLDLMLPGEDGLSLCRTLRAKSDTPVIMLTAKRDETDRIVGLEMGADDHVDSPVVRPTTAFAGASSGESERGFGSCFQSAKAAIEVS